MSRELRHAENPWRFRIIWGCIYIIIIVILLTVFYLIFNRIQTYTVPTGSVDLNVPYSKYLVGENITFTVTNNFNSSIQVSNGCPGEPLHVFKLKNGKWVQIHDKTNIKNCKNQPRTVTIPANMSMTASFKDWPDLFAKPGKYRIVLRVDFYNSLPYQDFEVIKKPAVAVIQRSNTTPTTTSSSGQSVTNTSTRNDDDDDDEPQQAQASSGGKTYTVYVSSGGYYSPTSVTMNAGDILRIIYAAPYHDEVRTRFTAISPTSTAISSITVDEERHSATRTFSTKGSWHYKADDHNGNTGTITVK